MIRKRKLCLVMAVLLTFALLVSACGDRQASQSSETPSASVPPASNPSSATPDPSKNYDPFGKYAEPIEITAVGVLHPVEGEVPEGTTPENQSFNKLAEEQLNIKLKYLWTVTPDQYDQKFNVTIATGDIPDLIFTTQPAQFENMIESGQLADMSDAYQYLLPELKEMYEKDVPEVLASVQRGDKLYSLPVAANRYESAQRLYIRNDWLKKLKLNAPTNYQEMVAVAEAFVNQDPDGNNKKDTVGLAIHKNILWGGSFGTLPLFQVFHAYPGYWVTGSDNQLHDGIIAPEVKNALEGMQDLYKKGILDKEFATKDDGMVVEDIIAGKVGMVFGEWWIPEWPLGLTVQQVEGSDWTAIPVPSVDANSAMPIVKRVTHYGFNSVSADCKNPEAAVKLINLFYDAFYNPKAKEKYGELVEQKNGFFHNFVPQKLWDAMASVDEFYRNNEAIKTRDSSKLPPRELNNHYVRSVALLDNKDPAGWGIYNCMVADNSGYAYVAELTKSKKVIFDEFYGVPTEAMIEKGDTLSKMAQETFVGIIMGDSVDEFDSFVAEYKGLGGDDIEKDVNGWYQSVPK